MSDPAEVDVDPTAGMVGSWLPEDMWDAWAGDYTGDPLLDGLEPERTWTDGSLR